MVPNTTIPIADQIVNVRHAAANRPHLVNHYDRMMESLPVRDLAGLIATHGSHVGMSGQLKYLDCPFWILNKLIVAQRLRLDRTAPLRVLDIGMGGGHFSYVLKHLGHDVIGIDIANTLYEDICRALEVRRETRPVELGKPLGLGARFDLVTAFAAQFFSKPGGDVWSTDDWTRFLHDLIAEVMHSPGRIYFTLNRMPAEAASRVDLAAVAASFGGQYSEKGSILDIPV